MNRRDGENGQITREELEQVQLERLQSTLNRAYKNVRFYREQFDAFGVDPSAFVSVRDLAKLPFTTREDLGRNYPYGMFAVPLRDIVRINSSAGTTARPLVVGYTRADLKVRDMVTARFLAAGGVADTDIAQICLNPGLSDWGRALKEGAEYIGASVMPMVHMGTAKQLMAMEDYKTSVLLTLPSYAMHLMNVITRGGKAPDQLALKAVLTVGEPLEEGVRRELESAFGVSVTAGWGLSDLTGPGVAFECRAKSGYHVSEDHFLAEIVNPQTGEPCGPDVVGEVVLTTMTAKAFPLIRLRTGDLASTISGECSCGRSFRRITGIKGSAGDVLTVRGVKVSPSQVETILRQVCPEPPPRFLIRLRKEEHQDRMEIWLQIHEAFFSDELKIMEGTLRRLRAQLAEILGFQISIVLVEASTLERCGKASGGVIDDR